MGDIPVGSELLFSRDENIKAKVIDNKLIECNGEVASLSATAQKLLGVAWPAQGPIYWIYKGETLDERRKRFESEE